MSTVPPYQAHSETSRLAALAYASKASTAREKVFRTFERSPGGLTDEEVQTLLGMSANTQRPRRVELERKGLVCDSGSTRETSAGQLAVVWVVTGKKYPSHWPSAKAVPSTLHGDAKALFEIQQAIPSGKRSPELKALLARLESEISHPSHHDPLDDLFS